MLKRKIEDSLTLVKDSIFENILENGLELIFY